MLKPFERHALAIVKDLAAGPGQSLSDAPGHPRRSWGKARREAAHYLPPSDAAIRLLVAEALADRPDLVKALRRAAPVIVFRTCDEATAAVLGRAVADLALANATVLDGWGLTRAEIGETGLMIAFAGDAKKARTKPAQAAHALLSAVPVIASATDPGRELPAALVAVADAVIDLPRITPSLVDRIITLFAGRSARPLLSESAAAALSLEALDLCVRADRTPATCVALLSKMNATPLRSGPGLSQLAGYGEARSFGLALAADLRLYSQGALPWSEVAPGALFVGPPGVGKTTLCAAIAQEAGVPMVATSVSEWLQATYLGDVIRAVRASFAAARQQAPAILFVDEINGLRSRSLVDGRNADYWLSFVNAVLAEVDSLSSDREGVVLLGACNDAATMDPALLRSGRLDRVIHIDGSLTEAELAVVFRQHLGSDLIGADLSEACMRLAGCTGADAHRLVREARRLARIERREMVPEDLTRAGAAEDNRSAAEKLAVARHEAAHAVAQAILGESPVLRVSIRQSGDTGGHMVSAPSERIWATRGDLLNRAVIAFAGRASDAMFLGEPTTAAGGGPNSDLAKASKWIIELHTQYALGGDGDLFWRGNYSPALLPPATQAQVAADLSLAYSRAQALVRANREVIERVARALVAAETLDADALQQAMGKVKPSTEHQHHTAHSVERDKPASLQQ